MKTVVAQLAYVTLCLSVGFAAGWWGRELMQPQSLSTDLVISPSPQKEYVSAQQPASTIRSTAQPNSEPEIPPVANLLQQFHRLLDKQAFDEAMVLYEDVESVNEELSQLLRQILIEQLHQYLQTDHHQALMALVDIYLSSHYDDTDVLLILARYQWLQGYPQEAARVYQMAFTYAYQPAELTRINKAFITLISDTDGIFSGQERWLELINFYEFLDSISLLYPQQRLRQGQLYQHIGDYDSARRVLLTLLDDSQWRSRAQALLDDIAPAVDEPADVGSSVPLSQVGNHYLVDAQLNQQTDVVLMIDTGASVTSLSQQTFANIADKGRFTLVGTRLFNTANGITKAQVYRAQAFLLGEYKLQNIDIAVLDFDQNDGVDGLLGMNVLRNFRFEIDQDQRQLLLQPRQ